MKEWNVKKMMLFVSHCKLWHTLSWFAVFIFVLLVSCTFFSACSNQKNTAMTRRIQAVKAKYNTYFNGQQSYIEGVDLQASGNKDNLLEPLPLLITSNKQTLSLGKSKFDRAIEKSQKTIKQHSITARPKWTSKKKKTQKVKDWLSQREYNPFLYKAWFLLGDAQFRMGEYLEASSTYAYMQRLYEKKPDIVAKARMLEAKCYAEMDLFYQSEDLVERALRDSFPQKYNGLRSQVLADCNLRQKKFAEAIPYVNDVVKITKEKNGKARLYYLLGQLYSITGNNEMAYKSYGKVIKKNPSYEITFNARIQQTVVMSAKNGDKKIISKLNRMAKNPKNLNYLDQVYFALGNVYLAKKDTMSAIKAYKDGLEKSTSNGPEKGVLQLKLGQLYWDKELFAEAKDCYSAVLGLIDKDRPDYKDIDERSKILDELYPYSSAVELQDSLQRLARMDSVQRMNVIKKIIEDLKKKEKESEQRADMANTANQRANNAKSNAMTTDRRNVSASSVLWYFYNPTTVASGKQEFQKKWGTRKLADDWRRKNVTVLDEFNESDSIASDSIASDSLAVDGEEIADNVGKKKSQDVGIDEDGEPADTALSKEKKKLEEYKNDPHRVEFYLKDIPLTEEQMKASNAALSDGLFHSAIIYKDRMENFPLAERTFMRLLRQFPDYKHEGELHYNLFQLYSRTGDKDKAKIFKDSLIANYPTNVHTAIIADPNFEFKARYGIQYEDSVYQQTYTDYVEGNYQAVVDNAEYIAKEYPDGANRPRFMFLNVMSLLNLGQSDKFYNGMKEIVEKYPKSTVSELAGLYVKGLKEGRLLSSGVMDNGSIWDRRAMAIGDGDSISSDTAFVADKDCNYLFVVAYEKDSINENALQFVIANYNFSKFSVRNFDIEIVKGYGINMLQVREFRNFDEAYIYLNRMQNDEETSRALEGLKVFIIAEDNLKKLMNGRSFSDYFSFYEENLGRVANLQLDEDLLDEPTEIPSPEDYEEEEYDEEYWEDEEEEENYIF